MALRPVSGSLKDLPLATLTALQTQATQALTDILLSGQAHTIMGRSFTQANIESLEGLIAEINAAISFASGTRVRKTLGSHGGFTR